MARVNPQQLSKQIEHGSGRGREKQLGIAEKQLGIAARSHD
jgi:hypothetical protein